jgi:hypothetical protein
MSRARRVCHSRHVKGILDERLLKGLQVDKDFLKELTKCELCEVKDKGSSLRLTLAAMVLGQQRHRKLSKGKQTSIET